MAGSPLKRRRREQEQREAEAAAALELEEIPDAVTEQPRLRAVPNAPPGKAGYEVRRAADHAHADALTSLSRVLRPGLRVQIERVKPYWAAGVLETDYVVAQGGVQELLEHLCEEWGGSAYKLTVLRGDGVIAWESRISVGHPPKFEGRLIYRETWGGEGHGAPRAPNPATATVPVTPPNDMWRMMQAMFELVSQLQERSSGKHLEAIRDIVHASRNQNQELIDALVKKHELTTQAESRPSLAEQLSEFAEAQRAIERAGKAFGAARPVENPKDGDDDVMKGAVKEAMKHFVGSAIASEFGGKRTPAAPRPPTMHARAPARVHTREARPIVPQNQEIPDAIVTGQGRTD